MQVKWSKIPCFAGVGTDVLQRLDEAAHSHDYQAGATIFTEGAPCAGFHIVIDGLVRIYRISPEGRLHTLSLLRPLASFNEVGAVDGGPNPYNAVAVTDSTIVRISHSLLMERLASERDLLQNYIQTLAQVNREYIERLEDMTFRTIPSRLAKLFLHETTYAETIAEPPTKLTQEEIASILGTGVAVAWHPSAEQAVASYAEEAGPRLPAPEPHEIPDFDRLGTRVLAGVDAALHAVASDVATVAVGLTVVGLRAPENLFVLARERPWLLALIVVLYPVLSALPQEIVFRPLFFRRYGPLLPAGAWVQIVLNSALFAAAHLVYWSGLVAAMTFAGSVAFAYAYRVRGNFPEAVVLHAMAGIVLFTLGLGIFFYTGNVRRPF